MPAMNMWDSFQEWCLRMEEHIDTYNLGSYMGLQRRLDITGGSHDDGGNWLFYIPDRLQETASLHQSGNLTIEQIGFSTLFNLVGAICAALWFFFYRSTSDGFKYLTPKRYVWPAEIDPEMTETLLKQPTQMFSWCLKFWHWNEDDILRAAGHDAVIYLRIIHMCFKIVVIFSVYAFTVLLPVNWNGGMSEIIECVNGTDEKIKFFHVFLNDDENKDHILSSWETSTADDDEHDGICFHGWNRLSVINVRPGNYPLMFAHFVGTLLMTGLMMYYLNRESQRYVELRRHYLRQPHPHRRCVVVQEIPASLRTHADLEFYFGALYPDMVEEIIMMRIIPDLEAAVAKRDALLDKLEHKIVIRERQAVHELGLSNVESKIEKEVLDLKSELRQLNEQILSEQAKVEKAAQESDRNDSSNEKVAALFRLTTSEEIERFRRRQSSVSALKYAHRAEMMNTASRKISDQEMVNKYLDGSDEEDADGMPFNNVLARSASDDNCGKDTVTNPIMRMSSSSSRLTKKGSSSSNKGRSLGSVDELNSTRGMQDVPLHDEKPKAKKPQTPARAITLKNFHETQHSAHKGAAELFKKQDQILESEKTKHDQNKTQIRRLLVGSLKKSKHEFGSKAFVVFKEYTPATVAPQVLHSAEPGVMHVSCAPDERDIFWGNMDKVRAQTIPRKFFVDMLVFSIIVFFVVISTGLALLCSVDVLKSNNKGLTETLEQHPLLEALLTFIHPTLLLIITNLLPPIMTGLGLFEGCLTWSQCSMRQMDRYLWFLLINVLLVTTITGKFYDTMYLITTSPPIVLFLLLGSSIPIMSGFFLQYLIVKACIGLSMEINRGLAALQMVLRWVLCIPDVTRTDRLRIVAGIRRWNNPGWLPFGKCYANVLLIMVICMTYATIAPLVLVGGIMWFGYAQIAYRHSLLFVYEPRFETGGNFFPVVFRRFLYMLMIAQASMIGIFFLKDTYLYAYATILLLLASGYYTFYMSHEYAILSTLPLELSIHLDLKSKAQWNTDEEGPLETGADYAAASARYSLERTHQSLKEQGPDESGLSATYIKKAKNSGTFDAFYQPALLDKGNARENPMEQHSKVWTRSYWKRILQHCGKKVLCCDTQFGDGPGAKPGGFDLKSEPSWRLPQKKEAALRTHLWRQDEHAYLSPSQRKNLGVAPSLSSQTAANTTMNGRTQWPQELSETKGSAEPEEPDVDRSSSVRSTLTRDPSIQSPTLDMEEQFPDAAKSPGIPSSQENGIGRDSTSSRLRHASEEARRSGEHVRFGLPSGTAVEMTNTNARARENGGAGGGGGGSEEGDASGGRDGDNASSAESTKTRSSKSSPKHRKREAL